MNSTIQSPTIIEFSDFQSVEPEDLISLSPDYKKHIEVLKNYVYENEGQYVEIVIKRINSKSSISRKKINGRIKAINGNSFTLMADQDMDNVYDHEKELVLRWDNPLGNIPMLPSAAHLIPVGTNSSELLTLYFAKLAEMMALLKKCIGVQHAVTLHYHYHKKNDLFRKGKYRIECEILEVNKSNIKIKHIRSFTHIPGEKSYGYVVCIPHIDFDRYAAPDRYLQKVIVHFGTSHQVNINDD
jgi:hypothetical protein